MASLVTMGLAPGAALVILTFGSASNLSCIVPTLRFFGKRLTTVLVLSSLAMSLTGGYLLNLWMAPTLELRASMRPAWTLADSGGGGGILLPDC